MKPQHKWLLGIAVGAAFFGLGARLADSNFALGIAVLAAGVAIMHMSSRRYHAAKARERAGPK